MSKPLYSMKSELEFNIRDIGRVLAIRSPVECERNLQAFMAAIGDSIEVDGVAYVPKALECYAIGRPIRVGESISIAIDEAGT